MRNANNFNDTSDDAMEQHRRDQMFKLSQIIKTLEDFK